SLKPTVPSRHLPSFTTRRSSDLGLKFDPENLIGMKVQGITPEYVKGMQALGFKPDTEELIGMKVQGITPDYVKGIEATGLKPDRSEEHTSELQSRGHLVCRLLLE